MIKSCQTDKTTAPETKPVATKIDDKTDTAADKKAPSETKATQVAEPTDKKPAAIKEDDKIEDIDVETNKAQEDIDNEVADIKDKELEADDKEPPIIKANTANKKPTVTKAESSPDDIKDTKPNNDQNTDTNTAKTENNKPPE